MNACQLSNDDELNTRLRLGALEIAGCEQIFQDLLGGALRFRPQLDQALAELRAGDTLAWTLDRVGRSLYTVGEPAISKIVALCRTLSIANEALSDPNRFEATLGNVSVFGGGPQRDFARATFVSIGQTFRREQRFERGEPMMVIGVAVVAVTVCLRVFDFGCQRFGPFGPRERAYPAKSDHDRKRLRFPWGLEHGTVCVVRDFRKIGSERQIA